MYICSSCDKEFVKWQGQCESCGEWNCIEEIKIKDNKKSNTLRLVKETKPIKLSSVKVEDNIRFSSNFSEIDRVLGGGFVLGSSIVIGGEPGIGKSTLALQLASLAKDDFKFMYFSGEESQKQIKLRASRIGIDTENLMLSEDNTLEIIKSQIRELAPSFVIIDSIHTIKSNEISSSAGSISQVTNCSHELSDLSRELNFTLILVGHITKEGVIAGPKVLEHLVDTILYFEKIDNGNLRVLRTSKNRFGATDEIGVFNMTDKGLEEIIDTTSLFTSNQDKSPAGSVISSTHEGTRPILIEVQSLVSKPTQSFGKRYSTGIDLSRINLIVSILEKYCDLKLSDKDIFISLAKGIRVKDISNDLAVAVSIYSSFKDMSVMNNSVFIGELGLSGDVKKIDNIEKRIKEIARLGFKYCIVPKNSKNDIQIKFNKIKILEIEHIKEIEKFFN